ncbi:MAG: hypothetical protein ACHQF0_07500 [Chitinophagales bacterium]
MKKYLLLLTVIFFVTCSYGQKGFGFDVGIASSKAPMLDVKYFFNKNAASIGVSYQIFNDALGKKNDLIPGTYAIGDGNYFFSVDIGYTRIVSKNFSVSGEVSIGQKSYYQNLSDNDFSAGGYHRITSKTSKVGVGGIVTYNINAMVGVFAGYNSLRQAAVGVELRFVH